MPVRIGGRSVLNIAHRGARSLAPENTLASARKAHELGADLWELDVAVTKDHELILFHDDSLARTTDVEKKFPGRAPGPFSEYTLEEFRSLDAGSWYGEKDPHGQIKAGAVLSQDLKGFQDERVPSLREALEFTREKKWKVDIELKKLPAPLEDFPVTEKVLDLIEELKLDPASVILSSGMHDWLHQAQKRRGDIEVQPLVGLWREKPMDWSDYSFKTYNVRHTRSSPEEIRSVVEKGLAVNVYVVNEEKDMRAFVEAGASGIITDFPHRLNSLADKPPA